MKARGLPGAHQNDPPLLDLPSELSEDLAACPKVTVQLKAGNVMRVILCRVGDKVLEVVFSPNDDGTFEVCTEWSTYNANTRSFRLVPGSQAWSFHVNRP